jgi:hypothetical protein
MSIFERIRLILNREKISDKTVAGWLGLTPQRLSQKFRDNRWDSLREIEIIAEKTGYRFEWIHSGTGSEKYDNKENLGNINETEEAYLTGKAIRTLTVTIDASGQANMAFIPVHLYNAYIKGYADQNFIKKLTTYTIPKFSNENYRMFQVGGNSMCQLNGGLADEDIVIGQYVKDIFSIRDNRVYTIVTKDAIYIKRCLNKLNTKDKTLILNSDNKKIDYPAITIHKAEIIEAWEVKAFISNALNFNSDLTEVINELQTQQAMLKEKIQKLESLK